MGLQMCVSLSALIFSTLISASSFASGSYPNWSVAAVGDQMMSTSNNIITKAVEGGHTVKLINIRKFREYSKVIFAENEYGSYMSSKLSTPEFYSGLVEIIGFYICTEYRYRNKLKVADKCEQGQLSSDEVEKMPFLNPPYLHSRLTHHSDSVRSGVGYEYYMENGSARTTDSALYPVHQMGTFFGRQFDSKQIVIKINILAYKLDPQGFRVNGPILSTPSTVIAILPTPVQITRQSNQNAAREFGINNTQLIDIR
ncbi:hypothetical protein KCU40_003374 [Vibrio vulnificus]|nr:hypothetical protein [Vibrio vulnificus]EHK2774832.1 hypothetical protein [Vibrio vulnificus]EHK9004511.1 hypothetical protein [Vibrio vulnificus]EIA1297868.1 hypothetical protein [Vibrio vulnificus]EIV8615950.1 hypothetical protein [Vibrio vulnificus]